MQVNSAVKMFTVLVVPFFFFLPAIFICRCLGLGKENMYLPDTAVQHNTGRSSICTLNKKMFKGYYHVVASLFYSSKNGQVARQ